MRADLSRRHVRDLLQEGATPEQAATSLVSMHWHRDSANELVLEVVGSLPAIDDIPSPAPDLVGAPSAIQVDGVAISVLMRSTRPNVILFGDCASPEECAEIMLAAMPKLSRSQVIIGDGELAGENAETYFRTSEQASFVQGDCRVVDRLCERIAALTRWPAEHMESAQVVRYRAGEDFAPHVDYFFREVLGDRIEREGQRVGTAIVYLNTPSNGGMTAFIDSELEIYPHQGNLLFFTYPRPDESSKTRHAGVPIASGEKWIFTTFLRDKPCAHRSPERET